MTLNDELRLRVRSDVLSRELNHETVLLDLETGTYFGLNEVAADVWSLLQNEVTVGDLRRRISETYDVSAEDLERDLAQLLADLHRRGLIEKVAAEAR